MARIELRDCEVLFKDGFAGTAKVNDTPANLDTTVEIDTVAGLTNYTSIVPIGARFQCAGHATVHVVTATNSSEVQMVTVTDATDGTFTLSVGGQVTTDIPHDAAGSAVESALENLSTVGPNNVQVTGNGPYVVEFIGA